MPPNSRFSTRSRAFLSIAGLLTALLLVEGILRIIPPLGPAFILAGTSGSIDNQIFQDDVELRVVLAPNVQTNGFTTNALGMRGEKPSTTSSESKRILAIGDSFTLGLQVTDKETFAAQITQALGPKVEVFNAGVPGYGTEQATELMRRLAPQIRADGVLLSVYTGNDFRDNHKWAMSPGLPTTPPPVKAPPPQPPQWMSGLAKYSRIVSTMMMFSALKNQEDDFRMEEFKDEILPFADRDHLNQLKPPTRTAMKRFENACNEMRVKCAVAIIPPAFVVHPERVERTFTAFNLDPEKAQLDEPQEMMRRSVPRGIPVLDLTEPLRDDANQRPYLVFDPHFSAAGHEIAAKALAPFLQDLVSDS